MPRYCCQNRICYCKKCLNVKVLFFLIKVWNMKNVPIWFQQKPIPQLSMFCLIQGINNYINTCTYWSYIVRICIIINLASNILLLASKKCFLTSQGLVGAGMNCRALACKRQLAAAPNKQVCWKWSLVAHCKAKSFSLSIISLLLVSIKTCQ